MKIVSWNVNSIRKGIKDELETLINTENPDIICFQETKCTEEAGENHFVNDSIIESFPYRYWNSSVVGQAGVSIWSKTKPLNVLKEIPRMFKLKEGRILILEFENLIILNTYVPNTGRGEIAEEQRKVWHNSLMEWLPSKINDTKLFIWCGDLNVVREPFLDTSHHKIRPKNNISAGLKEFEYAQLKEYLDLGLDDAFRQLYPSKISFTWFSPRNPTIGWRLDYFLVNDISKVEDIIHTGKLASSVSDHSWLLLKLVEDY